VGRFPTQGFNWLTFFAWATPSYFVIPPSACRIHDDFFNAVGCRSALFREDLSSVVLLFGGSWTLLSWILFVGVAFLKFISARNSEYDSAGSLILIFSWVHAWRAPAFLSGNSGYQATLYLFPMLVYSFAYFPGGLCWRQRFLPAWITVLFSDALF